MTHIWHKVLAKRDIGHIWDTRSNGTEDWARNGKVIRTSGFGVVLLSVWTCWGAWVQGKDYYGGWMIFCRKRRKSGVRCSGEKINLLSGAYSQGRIENSSPLDGQVLSCACGKNSDALF